MHAVKGCAITILVAVASATASATHLGLQAPGRRTACTFAVQRLRGGGGEPAKHTPSQIEDFVHYVGDKLTEMRKEAEAIRAEQDSVVAIEDDVDKAKKEEEETVNTKPM
jgi:hypothetical protein